MAKAAVPKYVAEALSGSSIAPGHTFNLYFPIFNNEWKIEANQKKDALKTIKISSEIKNLVKELINRQLYFLKKYPAEEIEFFEATSTSPFITGLGNEHPVENGFSFMVPYGIPYYAGSGVKGVLRRAAETLALFYKEYPLTEQQSKLIESFTLLDVWLLFGFEGESCAVFPKRNNPNTECTSSWLDAFQQHIPRLLDSAICDDNKWSYFFSKIEKRLPNKNICEKESFLKELIKSPILRKTFHYRGALTFFDVFPKFDNFSVEIMTPHYSHYYQNNMSPHDSGQPNPIPFLAISDRASFVFSFHCDIKRLPDKYDWKTKIKEIFDFACKWIGFGGKTSIGYGALQLLSKEETDKFNGDLKKYIENLQKTAEAESEKRAYENMSDKAKLIFEFQQNFEKAKGAKHLEQKFLEDRRKFMNEIQTWENCEELTQALQLLEETFKCKPQEKQYKDFKKIKNSKQTTHNK